MMDVDEGEGGGGKLPPAGTGEALTAGRIIDCRLCDARGVFALYRTPKPGSVFGVSGKADRSRGVPFISSCGRDCLKLVFCFWDVLYTEEKSRQRA